MKSDGLIDIFNVTHLHVRYFLNVYIVFQLYHKLMKVMIDIDGCSSIFYATRTFNFT